MKEKRIAAHLIACVEAACPTGKKDLMVEFRESLTVMESHLEAARLELTGDSMQRVLRDWVKLADSVTLGTRISDWAAVVDRARKLTLEFDRCDHTG